MTEEGMQGLTDAASKAAELAQSSVVKITKEAFRDAPPAVKVALYAPAISGAVFGIGLAVSLFTFDSGEKWLALVFGVLLLVGLYIPNWKPLRLDATLLQLSGIAPPLPAAVGASKVLRCRHVPHYPPDESVRPQIRDALEEIRADVSIQIRASMPAVADDRIRANLFLLAEVEGGPSDGSWKLVVHSDFAINMNHPPERDLQFFVGQGATGVAFRDGMYQLTRRSPDPKHGEWDRRFQMTPALSALVHRSLKWIISMPLLRPDTSEAIGVVNIDGLVDVDDHLLNTAASAIRKKIEVIARQIALQPSSCVGIDKLGVIEHE